MKYKNAVTIVTGGCSGLGKNLAENLVKLGTKVVIADINKKEGQSIQMLLGKNCKFIETDIGDETSVKDMVKQAVDTFGHINFVSNTAAILPLDNLLWKGPGPEDSFNVKNLKAVFDVNFFGILYVTKYSSEQMVKQDPIPELMNQRGCIINVSSILSTDSPPGYLSYCGTKGAINSVCLPLARELGPKGIRVNTIAPGLFLTPQNVRLTPDDVKGICQGNPIGRPGDFNEYSDLCIEIFNNGYINGTIIRLDGGLRI